MLTDALAHFFEQLGVEWILYVLAVLLASVVWIVLERSLFHKRNSVDASALTETMLGALRSGGAKAAQAVVADTPGMTGVVLRKALSAHDDGVGAVEEVIDAAVGLERMRYNRYTSILGTIANNAPFIGLFGTVIGILNAFGQLAGALEGQSQSELVMGSISEALVATAVGLAVAIPSVVAFNVFRGKTKSSATNAVSSAKLVLAHLKATPQGGNGDA